MIVETAHYISVSEDNLKSTENRKVSSTELTDEEFRVLFNKMVGHRPIMFYMNKETADSLPKSFEDKIKII